LVLGGLLISYRALDAVSDHHGVIAGFHVLTANYPDRFRMIIPASSPHYKDLPGLSVLLGGLWVMNISYWGFNQYIIQRALAARSIREAQKGIVLAAFLKLLMPVIIVLPGIAAVALAPNLSRADEAYPHLMATLPSGILGLVFAALIAAIVASMGSKINSIATIFTMDVYRSMFPQTSQQRLVLVGRIAAVTALVIAAIAAKPLLGSFEQAFQYIQEFTGFFTPGICVIFLLGMFWPRCTASAALTAAIASAVLSILLKFAWPALPFMDRVGLVFLACLGLAILLSFAQAPRESTVTVDLKNIDYSTSAGFNIAALIVVVILIALYTLWW
jgi:SSS family solute:Na+ symporter